MFNFFAKYKKSKNNFHLLHASLITFIHYELRVSTFKIDINTKILKIKKYHLKITNMFVKK